MTPELFIRKICHDLRAPIRGLQEIPTWLAEDIAGHLDLVPEGIQELLDMLSTQAVRLDQIVVGLSDLAKLERSGEIASVGLSDCLAEVPEAARFTLHSDVETLPLEPEHARLVLSHLADNALRHGQAEEHGGDIVVAANTGCVHIAVRDFGPGIAQEHRQAVYEPLYTLKPRDDCEGSGMGLAIVQRIADIYGGHCAIHSNPDGNGVVSEARFPIPARA